MPNLKLMYFFIIIYGNRCLILKNFTTEAQRHRGTEVQRYRGFFYKDYRKDAKYAKSAKKRERIIGLCAFAVKIY